MADIIELEGVPYRRDHLTFSQFGDKQVGKGRKVKIFKVMKLDSQAIMNVACKTVRTEDDNDGGGREALERELDVFKKVQGDYVVKYIHHDLVQNTRELELRLYMELCATSLDIILERDKLAVQNARHGFSNVVPPAIASLTEAIHCFYDILSGLQRIHELGVLYRDLKPGNVLRTFDSDYKLCDFGISRFATGEKNTKGQGTLWYRAPEVDERTDYSYSADVYSAGVTLLDILVEHPQSHKNERKTYWRIYDQASGKLERVDRKLLFDLVKNNKEYVPVSHCMELAFRMTSKDPCSRPTVKQVRELLQRCLGGNYDAIIAECPIPLSPMEVDSDDEAVNSSSASCAQGESDTEGMFEDDSYTLKTGWPQDPSKKIEEGSEIRLRNGRIFVIEKLKFCPKDRRLIAELRDGPTVDVLFNDVGTDLVRQ